MIVWQKPHLESWRPTVHLYGLLPARTPITLPFSSLFQEGLLGPTHPPQGKPWESAIAVSYHVQQNLKGCQISQNLYTVPPHVAVAYIFNFLDLKVLLLSSLISNSFFLISSLRSLHSTAVATSCSCSSSDKSWFRSFFFVLSKDNLFLFLSAACFLALSFLIRITFFGLFWVSLPHRLQCLPLLRSLVVYHICLQVLNFPSYTH